jgi:hypothetical protein
MKNKTKKKKENSDQRKTNMNKNMRTLTQKVWERLGNILGGHGPRDGLLKVQDQTLVAGEELNVRQLWVTLHAACRHKLERIGDAVHNLQVLLPEWNEIKNNNNKKGLRIMHCPTKKEEKGRKEGRKKGRKKERKEQEGRKDQPPNERKEIMKMKWKDRTGKGRHLARLVVGDKGQIPVVAAKIGKVAAEESADVVHRGGGVEKRLQQTLGVGLALLQVVKRIDAVSLVRVHLAPVDLLHRLGPSNKAKKNNKKKRGARRRSQKEKEVV